MKTNFLKLRALIFEDENALRNALCQYLKRIGFEVVSFSDPCFSLFCSASQCPCLENQTCADVLISDIRMPQTYGVQFIQDLLNKGCRFKNIMIMSADFTMPEYRQSVELGFNTIEKPFSFNEIKVWLDECKKNIDPNRKLKNWYRK